MQVSVSFDKLSHFDWSIQTMRNNDFLTYAAPEVKLWQLQVHKEYQIYAVGEKGHKIMRANGLLIPSIESVRMI